MLRFLCAASLLPLCFVVVPALLTAQTDAAPPSDAKKAPSAKQQLPHPTTTVVVHGEVKDDYLPDLVTVGTLGGSTLMETPLSATVITRDLLNDQMARLISDVVKNDASVGEDYAPVGYFGDYQIRGYALDQETGFEVNGLTVVGEQNVPLENKESVEILKGISALESGVASGGGLIDYVTKRPTDVEAVDIATDHRGTAFGAVDLGHLFGAQKQVGARVNMAGERTASYVNSANGWRGMGAGAVDWKITPKSILKGDFEYQHTVGRSVCGYQLLGGTAVPDISSISPATMLGEQSWEKPNIFDTTNSNARYDYDLSAGWTAFVAASYSHALRDDNVVYAYGVPMTYDSTDDLYDTPSCTNATNAPAYFFCPNNTDGTPGGSYGIYDWREPGVLHINAQAEALVTGKIKTGPITHDVTGGGELFRRSVQLPGFYTYAYPSTATISDGPVYDYVGSENIYMPLTPFPMESPHQYAGPRRLYEDNHQASLVVQDRIILPGRLQFLAGGREDSMHDQNYSPAASNPCTPTLNNAPGPLNDPCPTTLNAQNQIVYSAPTLPIPNNKLIWLPQYAITFNPVSSLTIYGNYGVQLSLAPQASWFTDNGNQYLSPYFMRQAEVGAKYEPGQKIILTTALFHMRAPFFYPKTIQAPDSFCPLNYTTGGAVVAGDLCFESDGHDTHDGIELNAEGKATSWMRLSASATAIRAISDDSGTPSFNNKQVLNVPHLRTTFFADLALPHARELHLLPGWSYTGRKEATRDDAVNVPGYNLFNLGARYTPGGEGSHVTYRVYADNIGDKRYWKDTGSSGGDSFIHLGAPTTVWLDAHYTF